MKKFLLILVAFLIIQPVMAKSIKVQAMSNFSTVRPPKVWKVKILESFVADNGIVVHQDTVIEGDIVNVKSPQRLKRNATFKFVPKTYFDPQVGEAKIVKRDFEGKYSSRGELDAKTLAKKGAVSAGNMFIGSFVAPTVGFVEGAIKNERGNRVKSAAISAYESTPLSYANKGKEIEIKSGQIFFMNFKLKNEVEEESNLPNYSYEMAE